MQRSEWITSLRRISGSIGCVLLLCRHASGAQLVEVEKTGGACRIANRLRAPIALMTQQAEAHRFTFSVVVVPPQGSIPCPSPSPEILRLELLQAFIPQTRQLPKAEALRLGNLSVQQLESSLGNMQSQLDHLATSDSPEARKQLEITEQIAKVQLAQRLDEIEARRQDPVGDVYDMRATRSLLENHDFAGLAQHQQEKAKADNDKAIQDLSETLAAAAVAFDSVESAKLSQLSSDKDRLKELLDNAEALKKELRAGLVGAREESVAGQGFSDTVAKEINVRATGSHAGPIRVLSGLRRQNTGRSGSSQLVEAEIEASPELAVLVTSVSFDRGRGHTAILRRVDSSNLWQGEIFWAPESSEAKIQVRYPGAGSWVRVSGSVRTGREPLTAIVDHADRSLARIRKEYKNTAFRAQGGDEIRTLAIP